MAKSFISIGESVHASIPRTGKVMAEVHKLGENAFTVQSEPLNYIKGLIESQADEGAAYIAVNVDAFGEDDPQTTVKLMIEYVKLVRKWGKTVPVCIDSSNSDALIAGLKEWSNTDEKIAGPLLNSIKTSTMDILMPLKKDYDFSFVAMLVDDEQPGEAAGTDPVENLYRLAKTLFDPAIDKYGFKAEEIFFDTTAFPLAIDMPMNPGVSGFTYRTFQTIRKIKSDPKMKNAHCSLGVTNSVRDLPGRKIGVARAYVEVAMRYGLDAGIVNVSHKLGGDRKADPDLVKLVEAYAALDGSAERTDDAMMLMGKFCAENRAS